MHLKGTKQAQEQTQLGCSDPLEQCKRQNFDHIDPCIPLQGNETNKIHQDFEI